MTAYINAHQHNSNTHQHTHTQLYACMIVTFECTIMYIYMCVFVCVSVCVFAYHIHLRACDTPCLPFATAPFLTSPIPTAPSSHPGFGALDSGSTLLVLPALLYLQLTTHLFRAPARCFMGDTILCMCDTETRGTATGCIL